MRKLNPTTISNCDILIYDQLGEDFLYRCFPSNAVVRTLRFRDEIPVVSHPIHFFKIASRYLKYRRRGATTKSYAYLASLIDQINPRVIVTFADNNGLLGPYARNRKGKLIISIQNALRDSVSSFPSPTNLPVYFSFGHAEKRLSSH